MYSSETRRWDLIAAIPVVPMARVHASSPATLIGDVLYRVTTYKYIIAFDNTTKALYYVQCPQETHDDISNRRLHTFKGQNGGVGLAVIRGFTLRTWCRVRPSAGDHDVWILDREVDLSNLLVLDTSLSYDRRCKTKILCACEDRAILVIRVKKVVFQLDINSYKWKKIYGSLDTCTVYPFTMIPG